TAHNRMEQLMQELLEKNPSPDKRTQQMAWVQHMNSLKAQAEEIVLAELVYS
ncbi:MAG: TnpV protein, partial [Clostridiales bacterium]|nr:TnpV protein [Clostridiales bacterium]